MRFSGIFCKLLMALILSSFLNWAVAQQGGTSGTGTTPPDTGSRSTNRLPTTIGPPIDNRQRIPQPDQELIFIIGSVVMEDGTPLPFGTIIERDCGGTAIKDAVVTANGYFSYQLGDRYGFGRTYPDASRALEQDSAERELSRPSAGNTRIIESQQSPLSMQIMNCELRAQHQGYRSTKIQLGNGGPRTGIIEVGTIVLYPISRVQGILISASSLSAPKAAKKAVENGEKAFKKKDYIKAEEFYKSALQIYPEYAEAWLDLGLIYQQQQSNKEAINAFEKAIANDKLFIRPYFSLAQMAAKEKNWQEAADDTNKLLTLDPITFPEGYFLNALAYYNLGNLDLAEKSALHGQRIDINNRIPELNLILAQVLEKKNDAAGAIEAMKKYLKAVPNAPDAPRIRSRVQEDQKIASSAAVNPQE
jgi:tetratricopeptide (TPR) repeat protein